MEIRVFTAEDYSAIVDLHKSLNIVWPPWSDDPQAWLEMRKYTPAMLATARTVLGAERTHESGEAVAEPLLRMHG